MTCLIQRASEIRVGELFLIFHVNDPICCPFRAPKEEAVGNVLLAFRTHRISAGLQPHDKSGYEVDSTLINNIFEQMNTKGWKSPH